MDNLWMAVDNFSGIYADYAANDHADCCWKYLGGKTDWFDEDDDPYTVWEGKAKKKEIIVF